MKRKIDSYFKWRMDSTTCIYDIAGPYNIKSLSFDYRQRNIEAALSGGSVVL